jgi:Flp pilus assembly pilin Flp
MPQVTWDSAHSQGCARQPGNLWIRENSTLRDRDSLKTVRAQSKSWKSASAILRRGQDPAPPAKAQLGKDPQLANAGPTERHKNPMPKLKTFLAIDSDVTVIESALIASLVAGFIVLAVQLVGANTSNVYMFTPQ